MGSFVYFNLNEKNKNMETEGGGKKEENGEIKLVESLSPFLG